MNFIPLDNYFIFKLFMQKLHKYTICIHGKQIIQNFHRLRNIEDKEEFMRRNGIKFTYDSFYNMTIWADDGTLQLFPIMKGA